MQTIDLPSSGTSQPTKLCHDEMNYEKKIRFGGYNHPDYSQIRSKLKKFWMDEQFENMSINDSAVREIYNREGFVAAQKYLTEHEGMSHDEALFYLGDIPIVVNQTPLNHQRKEIAQYYHECCNQLNEFEKCTSSWLKHLWLKIRIKRKPFQIYE